MHTNNEEISDCTEKLQVHLRTHLGGLRSASKHASHTRTASTILKAGSGASLDEHELQNVCPQFLLGATDSARGWIQASERKLSRQNDCDVPKNQSWLGINTMKNGAAFRFRMGE